MRSIVGQLFVMLSVRGEKIRQRCARVICHDARLKLARIALTANCQLIACYGRRRSNIDRFRTIACYGRRAGAVRRRAYATTVSRRRVLAI